MKTFKGILSAVILPLVLAGCSRQVQVSGRVYVITQGQDVINMPACSVSIYEEASLEQQVAKCNAEIAAQKPDYESRLATAKANDEAKKKQIQSEIDEVAGKIAPLNQQQENAEGRKDNEKALADAESECGNNYQLYLADKKIDDEYGQNGLNPNPTTQGAYNDWQASVQKVNDIKARLAQQQATLSDDVLNSNLDALNNQKSELDNQLSAVDVEGEASKIRSEWTDFTRGQINSLLPISSVKTDVDGKFQVTLKKGSYVFISSGQRLVADATEKYIWYAPEDFSASASSKTIELNNDCEVGSEMRSKDDALYGATNNPFTDDDYLLRVLKVDASSL